MKTPNLLSAQQKYLPPKERSIQNLLKFLPFTPLILTVVAMIPALGRQGALSSTIFMLVYMLLISLLFAFMVKQLKKKYLKCFTDEQLVRMDKECLTAPQMHGLMVTSDAVMYFMPTIVAIPMQELVWVYALKETQHKGFILSQTYYAIVAVTRDKKRHTLLRENCSQERVAQSIRFLQEHLIKFRPHVIWGYSEGLQAMYKKDFKRMVLIADLGANSEDRAIFSQDFCAPGKPEIAHA